MSIASISSSLINLYAVQGAATSSAAAPTRHAKSAADADRGADRNERATGRRSVLVDAMLTALQELGLNGVRGTDTAPATSAITSATPAADAATPVTATADAATAAASDTSATSAATSTSSASVDAAAADDGASFGDVTQAVAHFAHALWSAVRGTDAAKAGEVGVDNDNHTGTGRRHHHRSVHGAEHGYDNLAERLAALASAIDPAAASLKTATETAQHAVATATAAQPAATAPAVDATAQTTAESAADATPATAAATATTIETTAAASAEIEASSVLAAEPTTTTTTTAPAAPPAPRNPLADAFGQLLTALRGGSAPSDSDSSALLSRFLQTLASALQPMHATSGAPVPTGALIDVTA